MKKIALILISFFIYSTPAFAEDDDAAESGFVLGQLVFSIIATGGISTTVGGAVGGGITTTVATRHNSVNRGAVNAFLQYNQTELSSAFQLGSGEIIDDLAAILQRPP